MNDEQLFLVALYLVFTSAIFVVAFQRRRDGPHPWSIRDSMHAILAFIASSSAAVVLLGLAEGATEDPGLRVTMTASVLGGLVGLGVVCIRIPVEALGLTILPGRWIAAGIGLLFPFMGLAWIYAEILQFMELGYQNQLVLDMAEQESGSSSYWLAVAHGSLLVPFLEEILFRGSLQPATIRRYGVWPGLVLTALFFGCLHINDPYAVPPLIVFGVLLGWLRLRSDSLWPPVALHATNNAVAFLTVGLL